MYGGIIRRNPKIARRIIYLAYYRGFSLTEVQALILFEMGKKYSRSTIWRFLNAERGRW